MIWQPLTKSDRQNKELLLKFWDNTVGLPVKIACFVKEKKSINSFKSSWSY